MSNTIATLAGTDGSGYASERHIVWAVNGSLWWAFGLTGTAVLSSWSSPDGATWTSRATITLGSSRLHRNSGRGLAVDYKNISGVDVFHIALVNQAASGSSTDVVSALRASASGTTLTFHTTLTDVNTVGATTQTGPGAGVAIASDNKVIVVSGWLTSSGDMAAAHSTADPTGAEQATAVTWTQDGDLDVSPAQISLSQMAYDAGSTQVGYLADNGSATTTTTGICWYLWSGTAWSKTNSNNWPTGTITAIDKNDWGAVARTGTDVHVVYRTGSNTYVHRRSTSTTYASGSWGAGQSIPTQNSKAASGCALATDGTSVWLFVIDSDAANTVRYIKHDGSTWGTWTALESTTQTRTFLGVSPSVQNNQLVAYWTEGSALVATVLTLAVTPPPAVPRKRQSYELLRPGRAYTGLAALNLMTQAAAARPRPPLVPVASAVAQALVGEIDGVSSLDGTTASLSLAVQGSVLSDSDPVKATASLSVAVQGSSVSDSDPVTATASLALAVQGSSVSDSDPVTGNLQLLSGLQIAGSSSSQSSLSTTASLALALAGSETSTSGLSPSLTLAEALVGSEAGISSASGNLLTAAPLALAGASTSVSSLAPSLTLTEALASTSASLSVLTPNLRLAEALAAASTSASSLKASFAAQVVTVVPSGTLGDVAGATGGSPQNHLIYATNSARWWFFTWISSDINSVRAYVSSGSDLASSTWAAASGSASPGFDVGTIDVVGGSASGAGGYGIFPVDGRQVSVGYASISGVDVVQVFVQNSSHWRHVTCRARLSGGTITWDTTGPTSGFTTGMPGNECAPAAPQALSIGISTTNRWHGINVQNFAYICGMPATVIDDGTANKDPAWGGTRTTFDGSTNDAWDSAIAPLASGFMLAVYADGTDDGLKGPDSIRMLALRYAESSSASLWPTTNVGAAIPNLSTASNRPQDWGMVGVSTTDIHVVRMNSSTVLEQVRYSGHGGSWSAKTTLPSTGLTGALAGGGVALCSDGTNVWCFVIDTDTNKSIKYIKWNGTSWDSSWTTIATDTTTKKWVTVAISSTQIGIAWTVGTANPYAVELIALPLNPPTTPMVLGGQIDGLSTVKAQPSGLQLYGTAASVSYAKLGIPLPLYGASTSSSSVGGDPFTYVASNPALGGVTASLTEAVALQGAARAVAAHSATATLTEALTGSELAVSSATATAAVAEAVAASAPASSALSGNLQVLTGLQISAASNSLSTSSSGTLSLALGLAATPASISTVSSTLGGVTTALTASSTALSSQSATVSEAVAVAASSAGASSLSANLQLLSGLQISGVEISSATTVGSLTLAVALGSSATASASVVGSVSEAVQVAASNDAASRVSGSLQLLSGLQIAGLTTSLSTSTATASLSLSLTAASTSASALSANVSGVTTPLVGSSGSLSSLSSSATLALQLAVSVSDTSTLSGTLQVPLGQQIPGASLSLSAFSGTINLSVALGATATAVAVPAGNLGLLTRLLGNSVSTGALNANLLAPLVLTGALSSTSRDTAALGLAVPLAASYGALSSTTPVSLRLALGLQGLLVMASGVALATYFRDVSVVMGPPGGAWRMRLVAGRWQVSGPGGRWREGPPQL